jgi:hypothetical protein
MSKCTTCDGTGTAPCITCHGQGYFSRVNEDGDTVQRLCGACEGKRQVKCGACRGTGDIAPIHDPNAGWPAHSVARPAAVTVDRLAGKWKAVEGTWYEFVPDGGRSYRVTGGGLRDVSATGKATLTGHTVTLEANDKLLGPYSLELMLRGNHLEGIDRKAGFPLPVTYTRA